MIDPLDEKLKELIRLDDEGFDWDRLAKTVNRDVRTLRAHQHKGKHWGRIYYLIVLEMIESRHRAIAERIAEFRRLMNESE